jgi:hypothetical protein
MATPVDDLPENETPATPEPDQPAPIDIQAAIEAVSQHYGWDPRAADFEIRELGQRKAQVEREKRELEILRDQVRRAGSIEVPPGYEQDPTFRTVAELAREMREDREERRREKEDQRKSEQLGRDLENGYNSLMARVPNKVDRGQFFNAMLEVYPDQSLLDRVGIERAVGVVHRYLTSNGGGYQNNQPQPRATRRESIVIPAGTTGGANAQSQMDEFRPPKRNPNEPESEYAQRYDAWTQSLPRGLGAIRDGQKISSG